MKYLAAFLLAVVMAVPASQPTYAASSGSGEIRYFYMGCWLLRHRTRIISEFHSHFNIGLHSLEAFWGHPTIPFQPVITSIKNGHGRKLTAWAPNLDQDYGTYSTGQINTLWGTPTNVYQTITNNDTVSTGTCFCVFGLDQPSWEIPEVHHNAFFDTYWVDTHDHDDPGYEDISPYGNPVNTLDSSGGVVEFYVLNDDGSKTYVTEEEAAAIVENF